MADVFSYDVFLSYSSKDKAVVRDIAERLRADSVRVWFDEWELKSGDSIPVKIEEGLESSRLLVLCMSKNMFGSEWAKYESYTFRFRDPLNRDRRFIPLRLDEAPIKGGLAQFLYIDWLSADRKNEYLKLLESCRFATPQPRPKAEEHPQVTTLFLGHIGSVNSVAWSGDWRRAHTFSRPYGTE
jgi:hypothetical protein